MKANTLDLDKLKVKDPKEKYGFIRELLKTGEENPARLYRHFECWSKMLASDNNILKWAAIDIIGYISAVDTKGKTDTKIDDLFRFLHCGHLITCNHAISALGRVAKNKPALKDRILKELISVSSDTYDTETCKDIAMGKVLEILGEFPEDIKNDTDVLDFISQAQTRKQISTKMKADRLLINIQKGSK
ncbi:MAG TPA: hypothetical protein VKA08_05525 [Balneolales bacterium]|nr:hypothetical protein [Balneolales bacterium]